MSSAILIDGSSALQPAPGPRSAQAAPGPVRTTRPTITWLRTAAGIAPLEGPWRELEARVQHRTALSTFDYNATWYGQYAGDEGGEALIGVARRESEVVGIAPLVIRRRRVGKVPLACVEFAAHEAYAGEFLVEDDQPETIAAFLDSLVRDVKFDVICLNDVDLATDRFTPLREAVARHRLGFEVTNHPNAVVDLSKGYDAYFRQLKGHFRSGVRRHARLIEEIGAPAIEGIELTQGLEALDDVIRRMVAINEASYKLNGQRLADCHRNFLAEIARRFGPRGMLSLPILSIGGRDAAFVIGMVERGVFYDVTLAYDEALKHVSPGSHLTQAMLRDLAGMGVHTFVSHGAHEYKKHWATALVPSARLFLFAPSVRAAATRFFRFSLHPLWRRLGTPEP